KGSQIGERPCGTVLGPDRNSFPAVDAQDVQAEREFPDSSPDLAKGKRSPLPAFLEAETRSVAVTVYCVAEQFVECCRLRLRHCLTALLILSSFAGYTIQDQIENHVGG